MRFTEHIERYRFLHFSIQEDFQCDKKEKVKENSSILHVKSEEFLRVIHFIDKVLTPTFVQNTIRIYQVKIRLINENIF